MKKILIVEDEIDIRESLQDLLSSKGFEIIAAANGKEGLFFANTKKPDLILSDIMMPEMNGFEFLELVQKNIELTGIPFIFLTAKMENASLRSGMNLGADDYLTKPVKSSDLLDAIHRRLEKAESIKKSHEEEFKKLLTQLSGDAQHEFNTPLNGILGFAELLKSRPNMSPQHIIQFAEIIESSGRRLKSTLDNLLWYRSIINRSLVNANEPIEVNTSFLENTIKSLTAKYKRENIILDLKAKHLFKGSYNSLQKIVTEIIDNSMKFSPKEEDIIICSCDNFNGIKIIDKGRGMTQEQILSIEAFKQFDREKFEQQGMGLGLFISKELARFHNWKIELEPHEPKGLICKISEN